MICRISLKRFRFMLVVRDLSARPDSSSVSTLLFEFVPKNILADDKVEVPTTRTLTLSSTIPSTMSVNADAVRHVESAIPVFLTAV